MKKYPVILVIAIIAGFGILGCTTAIDAQKQENKPSQNKKKDIKNNPQDNETEENEAGDEDSEDGDENEADEKEEQEALAKQAKITKKEAETIALKKVPGEVVETELEKEHGKLIYSVEIRKADKTSEEVEVDAVSGKVLKVNSADDDDDEDEPENQ